ncbi:hypothetical protein RVM26_04995 [Halomonas sp. KM072]
MKNLDTPDSPCEGGGFSTCGDREFHYEGMTKRERACIDLRIPESGDEELDALIRKARRQELAAKAMQGYLSILAWSDGEGGGCASPDDREVGRESASYADGLIAELERTNDQH